MIIVICSRKIHFFLFQCDSSFLENTVNRPSAGSKDVLANYKQPSTAQINLYISQPFHFFVDLKSTFELTKQIYDEKILSWVPAFLKLDTDDKIRVLERVNALFDDKNYFTKNK